MVESTRKLDHRRVTLCNVFCSAADTLLVTFGNLVGSLFFGAILVHCALSVEFPKISR